MSRRRTGGSIGARLAHILAAGGGITLEIVGTLSRRSCGTGLDAIGGGIFEIIAAVEIIRVDKGIVGVVHIVGAATVVASIITGSIVTEETARCIIVITLLQHFRTGTLRRRQARSSGRRLHHQRSIGYQLVAFYSIAEFAQGAIGMTLGTGDGTRSLSRVDGSTAEETALGWFAFGGGWCILSGWDGFELDCH